MTERKVGSSPAAQRGVDAAGTRAVGPNRGEGPEPRGWGTIPRLGYGRVQVVGAEPPQHQFRRILGAYLGGAEEIAVREEPRLGEETRAVVDAFCRRTAGMVVAFEGPSEIRLREPPLTPPPSLERRIDGIGRSVLRLHREAVGSWGSLPLVGEDVWERKDDEVDRAVWFLQRNLVQRSYERTATVLAAWTVVRSLERIADHATTLGRLGPRLIEVPGAEGLLRTLRQYHAQAMDHLEGSLRSRDATSANRWLDVGEALLASGFSLMDRLLPAFEECAMPASGAAAVSQALDSIRRTIAYAQDIAEVPLNGGLGTTLVGVTGAEITRHPGMTPVGAPARFSSRGPPSPVPLRPIA
jgi:hypothetical protein